MDWDGSIVHDNCDWFDNIEPLKTEIIMVTSGLATMTKNCMKKYKEKTDESDVNVNVLFVRLFLGGKIDTYPIGESWPDGWDGMGYTVGTGVATAQKIVQRPTTFLPGLPPLYFALLTEKISLPTGLTHSQRQSWF